MTANKSSERTVPFRRPTIRALASPQPAINSSLVGPVERRPLHERVWEIERRREDKLRLLQADKEEREGATFAPLPLGRVSERLARRGRRVVSTCWEEGVGGGKASPGAARANERRLQKLKRHEEVMKSTLNSIFVYLES